MLADLPAIISIPGPLATLCVLASSPVVGLPWLACGTVDFLSATFPCCPCWLTWFGARLSAYDGHHAARVTYPSSWSSTSESAVSLGSHLLVLSWVRIAPSFSDVLPV